MRIGIRELIFFLLLLAMPVAAYLFVFEPRNQQIEEAMQEIHQKEEKLVQLEAATRNIADLGKEIDQLTEAISMFEEKLPAEREVDVILMQVWEMAAKQSLISKSIRTDKPVDSGQYAALPIPMTIVGDFDGFYQFLLELEKLPRITRIPRLKLKKNKKSNQGQMVADFVLNIFFEEFK